MTPATFGPMACISRKFCGFASSPTLLATRAAIESALEDNHVSEAELDLIVGAARPLGLSDEQLARIVEALRDHDLDSEERSMLDEMLGSIPHEDDDMDDDGIPDDLEHIVEEE